MSQAAQPQKQTSTTGNHGKLLSLDWPALALFFLLATAFWIPPLPQSMWSLPAILRVTWLTVLLVSSYIVLFRRRAKNR
jgi:hypothetical protein